MHLQNKELKQMLRLFSSANQALLAARAGATYVSPFLGRLDDIGQNGLDLISDIAEFLQFMISNRNYCSYPFVIR